MDVVYKIQSFIDNGNDDYNFKNIPEWMGNIIVRDNGFFEGIVTLKVFNEARDALICGNYLTNKMINFMIMGENIVIGATLIKTSLGYEGKLLISNYMIFDDIVNSTYNNSNNTLVTLDERIDLTSADIDSIKDKMDKILKEGIYKETYNSILSNNNEALVLLNQMYIQYKGNPKALTRKLDEY